ncbi:helix-turn-helix transcriptional regulator [Oceanimonas sp. CHS3-5]|uniref:AraC family transcriptional regulator n=1 Tax=Oceanimonas sp. CHS3-5 TaxID=3068186 RepID=UPI00273DAA98|nr:helix-turn-helix transcriptional regulator [Oceanimonas sp. CHS3-5]MDP5291463.1 helix-turn-helix transcriptional regulator [Oceanimonas sp. CHS3-5]
MKYRQSDNQQALLDQLARLKQLPRPVLGQQLALPNQAIHARHAHPWVQLSYAAEGVLTVETPHARFVAPPSRAVWIPSELEHGVHCAANTQIRSLYVAPHVVSPRPCEVVAISPLLRELILTFSRFEVEYDEAGTEGRLVAVLLDQLNTAPACALMLPWPDNEPLAGICHYLAAHPDCRRPMSHFSAQLGISDKTLGRRFVCHTGLGFRQWRQRARLLAALPLLEQNLRITDVALECGYDSLSAFIAAFGELLGCTPGEYVRRKT